MVTKILNASVLSRAQQAEPTAHKQVVTHDALVKKYETTTTVTVLYPTVTQDALVRECEMYHTMTLTLQTT